VSGGPLYQEVLRALGRLELPAVAERDVLLALESALPGPLPLIWAAGQEAGLARELLIPRGVGIFCSFAAGNLADDLCDGDCTSWEQPERHAPYVQFLLQNLAHASLARGGLSAEVLGRLGIELARAAGPQALEVRTQRWSADVYRQVAEGIAGRQWGAYLTALFTGTPLEARAGRLGLQLGLAAHTVDDVRTGDARFYTLPAADQAEVIAWALGHAEELTRGAPAWLERTLTPLLETLRLPEGRPATTAEVTAYYEAKTEGILRRYGPGPRVHFHTGLVAQVPAMDAPDAELHTCLLEAQEVLLRRLSGHLTRLGHAPAALLDVGCGLGGGSLYWASEHGAQVTAVTNTPGHVDWVERFAREAGVADRVRVELGDALALEGEDCFDTIVACESACYLPRPAWMAQVARLLKPGGRLVIADCFLGREEARVPFDRYWRTRIDTMAAYARAAREAGLMLEVEESLDAEASHFWDVTLALIERERGGAVGRQRETLRTSRREHRRLRDGLRDGALQYGVLIAARP
jgi:SAM-dependent methyltransferase